MPNSALPNQDMGAAGTPAAVRASTAPSSYMLLGLGLATWMEFYTYDGVNLVLPDMAGTLGPSQDQASWILTMYLSAMLFGVPLSIWLAAHVGHLRYIIGSTTVFAVAFVIGIGVAVYVMLKAARLMTESSATLASLREREDALIIRASTAIDQVGEQIAKTETIAASMDDVTAGMAELRGLLTDAEVDTLFKRTPSFGRPVDFE